MNLKALIANINPLEWFIIVILCVNIAITLEPLAFVGVAFVSIILAIMLWIAAQIVNGTFKDK